jgi:L-2-hydroxyglutarate oxidase LhgO
MDITIQNTHASAIVYIGGEGVTSSSFGYRLSPGAAWSVELAEQDALYAITNTNGSSVATMMLGLE